VLNVTRKSRKHYVERFSPGFELAWHVKHEAKVHELHSFWDLVKLLKNNK